MRTGIQTTTKFFPLAFFLYAFSPTIEINGTKYPKKWGTDFFELAPGNYTVKIYFKYLFMDECGANSVMVTLKEGQVANVSWYMPPLIFLKGSMSVS
jgi:hypothetical protein